MGIDVLSRLKHIGHPRTVRHTTGGAQRHIPCNAIHRTAFRTRIVLVGQRRRGVIVGNLTAQPRELQFQCVQQPFRLFALEGLVVLATMAHTRPFPFHHIRHLHIREYHTRLGKLRLRLMAEVHIEIALRPRLLVIQLAPPRRILQITVEVRVQVRHRLFLEMQVHREAAHRLGDAVDAPAEGRTYQVGVEQFHGPHGMGVGDHDVGLQEFRKP